MLVTSLGSATGKECQITTSIKPYRAELTSCTSKQLIEDDGYRIEPVKSLRLGTVCDSLAIVTFTETPESDAVEIVKAERLSNRVDNARIRYSFRNNVGQVDIDEVDAASDTACAGAANLYEDQENDCDEEEKG